MEEGNDILSFMLPCDKLPCTAWISMNSNRLTKRNMSGDWRSVYDALESLILRSETQGVRTVIRYIITVSLYKNLDTSGLREPGLPFRLGTSCADVTFHVAES